MAELERFLHSDELPAMVRAALAHVQYETIHPFLGSLYYALLDGVRQTGDWEQRLSFFLSGVFETADGAVSTAGRLADMFAAHRA